MRSKRKNWMGLVFLAPSLIGVGIFILLPFMDVVRRSMLDAMGNQFVGLVNYSTVLENEAFQLAVRNTVHFLVVCIPLLLVLSLMVALLIQQIKGFQGFLKTTFLFPMAIPVASVVLLWRLSFDSNGFFNEALAVFGLQTVNWMNSGQAFHVLVFTYLWKNMGYDMILWLAALSDIPKERYEAASVDGAGKWQNFWYITRPALRPAVFVIGILSLVNCFKVFREAYLIEGNYPHESIYMLQHLFNNWFVSLDIQKMTAASVLLAITMLIIMSVVWHHNERSHE